MTRSSRDKNEFLAMARHLGKDRPIRRILLRGAWLGEGDKGAEGAAEEGALGGEDPRRVEKILEFFESGLRPVIAMWGKLMNDPANTVDAPPDDPDGAYKVGPPTGTPRFRRKEQAQRDERAMHTFYHDEMRAAQSERDALAWSSEMPLGDALPRGAVDWAARLAELRRLRVEQVMASARRAAASHGTARPGMPSHLMAWQLMASHLMAPHRFSSHGIA
jgi:hypothetical protein